MDEVHVVEYDHAEGAMRKLGYRDARRR